ncbi:DUF6603 domain-containing protein [Paracoccus laeviglucosivorans]|uniref:DUF6603 domain-containing protein n=1 Tax=Paracoccus laeviglucosivorans TaxID=1197861 RepID=A0A521DZM7_9RHOB|nr:DUF6603 domain-containing protein [Paracoccus laeviglucosivorans]SMO77082.1 hypothetical protein SAMN06265221_110120 [Paracoccus laeviglucosivorans]
MADDVFSAFGRGFTAFAHTRAADLVGDSFSDTGKLVSSLADGQQGTTKTAFDALKADVEQLTAIGKALADAIKPEIAEAKAAVQEMATELGAADFQADELARALTALGKLLVAYDNAITKVAAKVSEKAGGAMTPEQVKEAISGMHAPIKKLLNDAGGAVTGNFDKLCKLVMNVDGASDKLGDVLKWDYAQKRLSVEFASAGAASVPPLSFDGASLVAFFTYKTEFKAGIELKTKLKAGLRGDKLMDKIMPGQAPTADADAVAITLDTKDGLTFGSGKDKRLVLPVRFSYPAVELRELAIEQPAADNAENKNRVNVVFTVAGKLGDVFACVVEGGGVSIRWVDGGDPDVKPKIPSGAGLRLKTPAVTGGGYLRYDEVKEEYGGVFQLSVLNSFSVTAIGLLGTEPFNMVIVIGVRFTPAIVIGPGFTISGLGGLLAINRSLDSAALRDGLKDGVVGQLLFPADPVAAAPDILNNLGKIFPVRDGGFVIGPMAEIGWGSQAGFVVAQLGLVISLPDPKLVLLGKVVIGVPSAKVDESLRVVDLRAELMGEITPDYFFLKVSLAKSKVFKLEITGDICIFIQWGGEGAFVISVGGFFPGYEAPKQIGEMQRVGVKFAPPVKWLSVSVQAYVAITTNTVQFGGRVSIVADLEVAKAEAWLQLDALFQWAPHFYFEIRIDAGIKVSALGVTLAGVQFQGKLAGDKPFHLEGKATVEILWWDIDVDVGPIEWGESRPAPAPQIDPIASAAQALDADTAWAPLLPAGAASIVRLSPADDTPLYHPMGQIELRQLSVPLETDIDRIGSSRVTHRRINLQAATLGGVAAGAVWPLMDRFPPGHFLDLKDHEILSRPEYEEHASGLGMGAARGASFSAGVHAGVAWNTVLPHHDHAPILSTWLLAGHAGKIFAASAKMRARDGVNPYLSAPQPAPAVQMTDRGAVRVVSAETLAIETGMAGVVMPASAAAEAVRLGQADGRELTVLSAGLV